MQIQVREKWHTDHRHERFHVAARGAAERRGGGPLQSVRAQEAGPPDLRPRHVDTPSEGEPGHWDPGDADGLSQCRPAVRFIRHVLHRRGLHLLRAYFGEMRAQSVQADADAEFGLRRRGGGGVPRRSRAGAEIRSPSEVSGTFIQQNCMKNKIPGHWIF